MTIKDLIAQLSKFPDDADVEIFHDEYCGGGDSERFDDPAIFVNAELTAVYLTPQHYGDYLKAQFSRAVNLLSVSELDEVMK